MEKIVELTPAWDKRHTEPSKDYGVHGVDLRMYLKGDKGAVQFVLSTGWLLPETLGVPVDSLYRYSEANASRKTSSHYPMAVDLGYHSPVPHYEDQTSFDCELLEGGKCYYDGSSLNAERIFNILLHEGSDGVWRELEIYYNELFEGVTLDS